MYINPCRRGLACLAAVAAQKSPFGRMTLISGPEALLADRAVSGHPPPDPGRGAGRRAQRDRGGAARRAKLAEITSASLFSTQRAAVITNAAELPTELYAESDRLGRPTLSPIWPWWWCTVAGRRARVCWTSSGPQGVDVVDCPAVKAWELPQFVSAEAKRSGRVHRQRRESGTGRCGRPRSAGPGRGGPATGGRRRGWAGHRRARPAVLRRPVGGDQLRGRRRRAGRPDRAGDGAAPLGAGHRGRPGAGDQRPGRRRTRTRQVDHRRRRAAGSRPGSRGRRTALEAQDRCAPRPAAGMLPAWPEP